MIGLPGPEHFLFIPGVFLVGITVGWILGGRSARVRLEEQQRRAHE